MNALRRTTGALTPAAVALCAVLLGGCPGAEKPREDICALIDAALADAGYDTKGRDVTEPWREW